MITSNIKEIERAKLYMQGRFNDTGIDLSTLTTETGETIYEQVKGTVYISMPQEQINQMVQSKLNNGELKINCPILNNNAVFRGVVNVKERDYNGTYILTYQKQERIEKENLLQKIINYIKR